MKILRKSFITIGILFIGLINHIHADVIDGPEPITKYNNYLTVDDVDKINDYEIFNLYCSNGWKQNCAYKKVHNNEFISPHLLVFINSNTKNFENISSGTKFNTLLDALELLSTNDIIIEIPYEYYTYTSITGSNYREIIYHLQQTNNGIKADKIVKIHGSGNCNEYNQEIFIGLMYCNDGILIDNADSPSTIYGISFDEFINKYEAGEYRKDYYDRLSNTKSQSTPTKPEYEEYYDRFSNTKSRLPPTKPKYIVNFRKSLIITIILETFFLFFICKLFFKKDNIKTRKIILTGILASSITLPILRFVLPHIFHDYTIYAIVGEVFVTFVEIFIIKYILDINRQKATIASIACNLFSVIIGLLL